MSSSSSSSSSSAEAVALLVPSLVDLRSDDVLNTADISLYIDTFVDWDKHIQQKFLERLNLSKNASKSKKDESVAEKKLTGKVRLTPEKYVSVFGLLKDVWNSKRRVFIRAFKETYEEAKQERYTRISSIQHVLREHETFAAGIKTAAKEMRADRIGMVQRLAIAEYFGVEVKVPCAAVLDVNVCARKLTLPEKNAKGKTVNWQQEVRNPMARGLREVFSDNCISYYGLKHAKSVQVTAPFMIDVVKHATKTKAHYMEEDGDRIIEVYADNEAKEEKSSVMWAAQLGFVGKKEKVLHDGFRFRTRIQPHTLLLDAQEIIDSVNDAGCDIFKKKVVRNKDDDKDNNVCSYEPIEDAFTPLFQEWEYDVLSKTKLQTTPDRRGLTMSTVSLSDMLKENTITTKKSRFSGYRKHVVAYPSAGVAMDVLASDPIESRLSEDDDDDLTARANKRLKRACCAFITTKPPEKKSDNDNMNDEVQYVHVVVAFAKRIRYVVPFSILMFSLYLLAGNGKNKKLKVDKNVANLIISFINPKWFVESTDVKTCLALKC